MKEEDIPKIVKLYYKLDKRGQWMACVEWLAFLEAAPILNLRRPNEVSAPWHWIGEVAVPWGADSISQGVAQVHMWPHKRQWQIDSNKSQTGWDELADCIKQLEAK